MSESSWDRVNIWWNNLSGILKYGVGFLVVALMVVLLPTNVGFPYQFEKGSVWQYADLKAAFDFAVLKSDTSILAEKAALQAQLLHHYRFDESQLVQQEAKFTSSLDSLVLRVRKEQTYTDLSNQPEAYKTLGSNILRSALSLPVYNEKALPPDRSNQQLLLLRGNQSEKTVWDSLLRLEPLRLDLPRQLRNSKLEDADALMPLLKPLLVATMQPDLALDKLQLENELSKISETEGFIPKDSIFIRKGQTITESEDRVLKSYQKKYMGGASSGTTRLSLWLGYFLLIGLGIGLYLHMLETYNKPSLTKIIFLLGTILFFAFLTKAVLESVLEVWLIPYCIVLILFRHFHNDRVALVGYIVLLIIIDLLSGLGFGFIMIQLLAGLVVMSFKYDVRNYNDLFRLVGLIALAYSVGVVGNNLVSENSGYRDYIRFLPWLMINALLILLSHPLIHILGRLFGYTTSFRLAELSDLSHPLLKEMSVKAPGSFQHSVQVANLAEAAASAIGADALLVKVGALYHDIGKVKNPQFFIENQREGNPHAGAEALLSAQRIIAHVTDGIQLAKENRLPEAITRFIASHHGSTRVEYFYRAWYEQNPEGQIDEQLFRYPGPRPKTKEEVLLMLADSLEASARVLRNPTPETIVALVDRIIQKKIEQQQFINSSLTFDELEQCKKIFVEVLRSLHHLRIEYPVE